MKWRRSAAVTSPVRNTDSAMFPGLVDETLGTRWPRADWGLGWGGTVEIAIQHIRDDTQSKAAFVFSNASINTSGIIILGISLEVLIVIRL